MDFARNHLLDQNFGMYITPQDLILPYYTSTGSNYYRPWKWCIDSGLRDIGSKIDDQKDKFKITLDVQHFKPNEITVKVVEKEIIVEGKHEERQDNHGIISRHFKRRYTLPHDCLSELVSSTLSSDGILTVTAMKKSIQNVVKEITVPIQMCGPCSKTEQTEQQQTNSDSALKIEDIINNNVEVKNKLNVKPNECPLKSDVTEGTTVCTDKVLMQARKETDNLLKMASDIVQIETGAAVGKSEKALLDEMIEKVSEKNVTNISETSNFKSTMKETLASEEISSFKSSVTSSMKMSGEQFSEFVSEVISAELKEAAENI